MRTYPFKENPIGSVDSEILWYKQTDRQTHIQLLYYKDNVIWQTSAKNFQFYPLLML